MGAPGRQESLKSVVEELNASYHRCVKGDDEVLLGSSWKFG